MSEICDRCGRPVANDWWEYDGPIGPDGVLVIAHAYYGCDSGCCGLEALLVMPGNQGGMRLAFDFMHDEAAFVRQVDRDPAVAALPHILTHWYCHEDEQESPHSPAAHPEEGA